MLRNLDDPGLCHFFTVCLVWRGKHTSWASRCARRIQHDEHSQLLAEFGLVLVRPRVFTDRRTHKFDPRIPALPLKYRPTPAATTYAYMMMRHRTTTTGRQEHPACPPYHGKRETKFEAFVRDFSASP